MNKKQLMDLMHDWPDDFRLGVSLSLDKADPGGFYGIQSVYFCQADKTISFELEDD